MQLLEDQISSDREIGYANESVFDALPRTPRSHFVLHFYAIVYALLEYIRYLKSLQGQNLEEAFERFPFLKGYQAECMKFMPENLSRQEGLNWWRIQISRWEKLGEDFFPLQVFKEAELLSFQKVLAFVGIGLVEEDSRFGTLYADLQTPLSGRRPGIELVNQIVSIAEPGLQSVDVCQTLIEEGWVEAINKEVARSERQLRIPELIWEVVHGRHEQLRENGIELQLNRDVPALNELVFPDTFLVKLANVPEILRLGRTTACIIRGSQGSSRVAVFGAIARSLGLNVLTLSPSARDQVGGGVGPMCLLLNALPLIEIEAGPGEKVELEGFKGFEGVLGISMGLEGGVHGKQLKHSLTLNLPRLGIEERKKIWSQALGMQAGGELEKIINRFHLQGEYIEYLAEDARVQARMEGRENVLLKDVRVAARHLNRQKLESLAEYIEIKPELAQKLEEDDGWGHLVVSEAVQLRLRELEQRCRHRERLLDHLGPAFTGGANRGVRVLFSGPSGTGKTLAAKLMAGKLGMDLYRVDLASVINKYIGETEKNLHKVLSTAEALDVVLLLDEGDALLGNRTDVKSSNDRYANLETNYLLQRLEHYQGIVVVTTNLGENIDQAFQRRMDIAVEFLPPHAEERFQIWQLHLPENHRVEEEVMVQISTRCEMSGGQIRNAAQLAALLALDSDANVFVERWHVEQAVMSEYRKTGGICPLENSESGRLQKNGLQSFLNRF